MIARATRRAAVVGLLALAAGVWGCARGVEPGARQAIQHRYHALGEAATRGDRATLDALWTADPADAGSPLAALERAAAAGDTLLSWEGTLHRFRTVADTAVVDVAVRTLERPRAGGDRRITSAVIRAWWVPDDGGWRLVRSEAVGEPQTVGDP